MKPFRSVSGPAAPLLYSDINTDQVIPSAYLKDMSADLADGLFAYMRQRPDGSRNCDFVLEKARYRPAPILVVGSNFGCGSSREHAVWAMQAFGIRCVIGHGQAEFFRENCLKNGVLSIALDPEPMDELIREVLRVDGHEPFCVDLEACEIRGPGGYLCRFDVVPDERTALLEGLDDVALTLKSIDAIEEWEARAAKRRAFMQAPISSLHAPR